MLFLRQKYAYTSGWKRASSYIGKTQMHICVWHISSAYTLHKNTDLPCSAYAKRDFHAPCKYYICASAKCKYPSREAFLSRICQCPSLFCDGWEMADWLLTSWPPQWVVSVFLRSQGPWFEDGLRITKHVINNQFQLNLHLRIAYFLYQITTSLRYITKGVGEKGHRLLSEPMMA